MEGKKPKIEDIRSLVAKDSLGVVHDEGFFNLPDEADLREKKPVLAPTKPAITKPSRFDLIRQSSIQKINQITLAPNKAKLALKRKLNSKTLWIRQHQMALGSIILLVGLIFTFVKGSEAKDSFTAKSKSAEQHLNLAMAGLENGQYDQALSEANLARADIGYLQHLVQSWGQDIKYLHLLPQNRSKTIAYERILTSADTLLGTLTSLNQTLGQVVGSGPANGSDQIQVSFIELRERLTKTITTTQSKLDSSRSDLESVGETLNNDIGSQAKRSIAVIDQMKKSLQTLLDFMETNLVWLSGEDGADKRFLIVFQNNGELRGGSGGSLGSFGIAHFVGGKLNGIDFGTNIYKIDKAFKAKEKIDPPGELSTVAGDGYWVMKDSGWAVDGREALSKVAWFYEKETGNKIDGVWTIDLSAVVDLLAVLGPIELPQYQKTITAENFRTEVEYEVHKGYFEKPDGKQENEPKKILAEMMPLFFDKFFAGFSNSDLTPKLIGSLGRSIARKDVLLYFKDEAQQRSLDKLNLSGGVYPVVSDYLYVNSSNLNGEKSSLSIGEKIRLKVSIMGSGSVENILDLTRRHSGKDEWPDGINRNYIRLLLPDASKVKSFEAKAGNFERAYNAGYFDDKKYWLSDEAGKRAVNFWQSTKPGEESRSVINYTPNYKVDTNGDFNYKLLIQKQPGANPSEVQLELTYPQGFKPQNVKNYDAMNRVVIIKDDLSSDKEYSINFKRE